MEDEDRGAIGDGGEFCVDPMDHEVVRDGQRFEERSQARVFVGAAIVGEVARGDDEVGPRVEFGEAGDGAFECGRGVDDAVGELPHGFDVEIANLGDDHDRAIARAAWPPMQRLNPSHGRCARFSYM
jgi:hypothetical protein